MSQGASEFPISKLLGRVIDESGLRRSEFIKSLDYKSIPGGLRRLDEWLQQGEGHVLILDRIAQVYHLNRGELKQALLATSGEKAVQADAARVEATQAEHKRFRPYIHVEGEFSVPSCIVIVAVTGGRLNRIELPRELHDPFLVEKIPALAELMRPYLEEHNGACPFFGRAVAFRLVHWDESFRFSLDGRLLERSEGRFTPGRATARIGNKTVEGLFGTL